MKQLMFAFLVLLGTNSFAQNWDPILKNNVSAFYNNSGGTLAIKIDSITTTESDSVFHFYKTWDDGGDYSCFKPNGPSWIGANATKKLNNTWLFSNYEGESLTLHPKANVDSTWVFYTFPNGSRVNCTVSQASIETFMGVEDSVKTFTFIQVDENGQPVVPNPCENLSIKIAKNFGFVKLFPLRHFNYSYNDHYLHMELISFEIVGISKFELGKTVMSEADIYNYDIDDEFHYNGSYYSFSSYFLQTEEIYKITDIQYYESEKRYSISYLRHDTHTDYQNPASNYDTIYKGVFIQNVNTTNPRVYFPEEAFINYSNGFGEGGYKQTFWVNNRMNVYFDYEVFYLSNEQEGCWELMIIKSLPRYSPYGYAEGLGIIGWQDIDGLSQKYMAYYKKRGETWGTPLVITSTSALQTNNSVISPNPVKAGNYLRIEGFNAKNLTIALVSAQGKSISNYTLKAGETQIKIPDNLGAGLYILILTSEGDAPIAKKLMLVE